MAKQQEIAMLVGVHQAFISKILTGRRRPSWSLAKRLAAVVDGTRPEDWMDEGHELLREMVRLAKIDACEE